jgi:hypothetical protein
MNMISQGQVAKDQRKLFEGFLAGVAVAAIAIALAWGAFAILNAPKGVAPSATTIQTMQEPGLLQQRAGERGGAVAAPATKSVITDSLVEQRRGERGGTVTDPRDIGRSEHLRRGASLEDPKLPTGPASTIVKTGTNGFNGFGNTGYRNAMPALDQSIVEHLRGEHGALR